MSGVKELGTEAIEEMFQLATYAFNFERTSERRERFSSITEHTWNYGFFNDENQLTSQVMATPFEVQFHGQVIPMAGIGYVASYPEARGQGGINQLMEKILQDCKERKVLLSYLAPFSYPFYRRYGYETVFEKISYRLSSRDWPNVKKTPGKIVRTSFEEAKAAMDNIYHQMKENQKGGLKRTPWWWEYKFNQKKGNHFALYFNEKQEITGYLVYRLEGPEFVISEWGYLEHFAFKALARFIGSHSGAFETFSFLQGFSGRNLSFLLENPYAKMEIRPDMMARIVDIEGFLRKYPFKKQPEKFAIEIKEDNYAPWNNGIYEIASLEEEITVRKTEQTNLPLLSGSIQSFTQLLLGYQSLGTLVFHEKMTCPEELMTHLEEIIQGQQPILNDYF
ncbi:hypothetical protein D920_01333 [Enterococcus faecalis 13-SD-W-01]|nr:hypothetical protein D920_01333 [Enterococcus faecalis 13-SD-W-01]